MKYLTLNDFLKVTNQNKRLYIGSKSGFFYIGTKNDFLNDLKKLEKNLYNGFKNSLKTAKNNLRLTKETIVDTESKIKTEKDVEVLLQLKKDLKSLSESLERAKISIKYYTKAIETFKPLLEREIVYIHEKKAYADDLGTAIKLIGYESGSYWTYKEWLSK